MTFKTGETTPTGPSVVPWRELVGQRSSGLRVFRVFLLTVVLVGVAFIVIGAVGLVASIPDGDFKSSYQDEIPLMIEGTGLWMAGSVVLSWLRRQEITRRAHSLPASGCVVRVDSARLAIDGLGELARPTFWQRFRPGVARNPLLGLAVLFNLLATLVRIYAAIHSGQTGGLMVGFLIAAFFGAAVLMWIMHRGAVAAKRLVAVQWISKVGKLSAEMADGSLCELAQLFDRVRRPETRFAAIRLALTPEALVVLPNRYRPTWAVQVPTCELVAIEVLKQRGRLGEGITLRLRDGRWTSIAVRADADLLHQLAKIGAVLPTK